MTVDSPSYLLTSVLQDGQSAGSIVPGSIRTVVNSLCGIASSQQTASYQPALTDIGTCIEMNSSSALNFTVPANATVAFDLGVVIEVCQMGTGQVTLVAAGGVTLLTPSSLTTRAQYSTVSIRQSQSAVNTWVVSGDLT